MCSGGEDDRGDMLKLITWLACSNRKAQFTSSNAARASGTPGGRSKPRDVHNGPISVMSAVITVSEAQRSNGTVCESSFHHLGDVVAVAARGDSTMRMKHLGSGERVLSAEECGVVLSMSMAAGAHTCF